MTPVPETPEERAMPQMPWRVGGLVSALLVAALIAFLQDWTATNVQVAIWRTGAFLVVLGVIAAVTLLVLLYQSTLLYDVEKRREAVRAWVTILIVVILAVVIVGLYFAAITAKPPTKPGDPQAAFTMKDFVQTV